MQNIFLYVLERIEVSFRTINAATVASPIQLINELSVEYNFAPPNYEVTTINLNNILTLIANCTVIQDCITYSCTSEQSPNKKHEIARKVLELLNKNLMQHSNFCKYYVEPMIYLGVQFEKKNILYKKSLMDLDIPYFPLPVQYLSQT